MTDSSKFRLMAALVLAAICFPAAGKEPNQPAKNLKFEVDQRYTVGWVFASSRSPKGVIKPSHRAQLFIANLPSDRIRLKGRHVDILNTYFQGSQAIEKILDTPAGQKISPAQRKFLESERAIYKTGSLGDEVLDHFRFWVYAVSKDDAEKTVEAFIQLLAAEAEAKMRTRVSDCKELTEESIPETKKRISEVPDEIKAAQTKLDTLKKAVRYLSAGEARETILEFNKTLIMLEVEIAGLQGKVSANKEYMAQTELTDDALTKFQEILGDHIIELAGAQARKETAIKIRKEAEEFYDLHTQLTKLPKTLTSLKKSLDQLEGDLTRAQGGITDPRGGALPPKVFENNVVINLVHAD